MDEYKQVEALSAISQKFKKIWSRLLRNAAKKRSHLHAFVGGCLCDLKVTAIQYILH